MENYKQDTFYDIRSLSLEDIKGLLREAYRLNHHWHVDILKSIRREPIEMSFEDAMEKCDKKAAYTFIHRMGNSFRKQELEIGYRTMTDPDYFLWINVDESKLDHFISKYNLKKIN